MCIYTWEVIEFNEKLAWLDYASFFSNFKLFYNE